MKGRFDVHAPSTFHVLCGIPERIRHVRVCQAAESALDGLEIVAVQVTQGFLSDLDALGFGKGFNLGENFGNAHGGK